MSNLGGSNLGGGPYNGYSPQQTITNYKDSQAVSTRTILRRAWNGQNSTGTYNGYSRVITPFRAAMNSGDFLGRVNYSCGGPNQVNADRNKRGAHIGSIPQHCDTTGVPAASCNPKYVADSSDYIRFRKERAVNHTYNDAGFGGDQHNASYVSLMAVRRR
jgi:hypothetical protein